MIETAFLRKAEIISIIPGFIEDKFGIVQGIVSDQLNPMLDILIDELVCFIEYPYVDRFYRDTYYSFFSKKHHAANRDSVRLSFFKESLDVDNYFQLTDNEIKKSFLGYICLRPTSYRIIGNSFLSPNGLKNKNFVCCINKKVVSIYGRKISVFGFPYCSQDNESITCSEASLINVMDYFGHQYPEYSTILPSQVAKILSKQSYQRQLPAHGLPTESISYVLKKIGFGTVVYSNGQNENKSDIYKEEDFKDLLYMYIESGIPIIATLSTKNKYHAVLVIGREDINREIKFDSKSRFHSSSYEFSRAFNKVLIMNDNHPPYEMVDYNKPLVDKESGECFQFSSFIVPLYTKVFLEAYQFKRFFFIVIDGFKKFESTRHIKFVEDKEDYIYRFFLTSSKSYKNYIANAAGITQDFKSIIINKSMPKFIWVGEIMEGKNLHTEQLVKSIVVVDATESGFAGHLIFATNLEYLIIKRFDKREIDTEQEAETKENSSFDNGYKIFKFEKEIFYTFVNNLKGRHTSWQN